MVWMSLVALTAASASTGAIFVVLRHGRGRKSSFLGKTRALLARHAEKAACREGEAPAEP
jgi:hypothetical protein